MTSQHWIRVSAFAIACFAAASTVHVDAGGQSNRADRRLISESDILQFAWVADPQITPDGSTISFVRVVVNDQKDDYETSIWLVPASGAEPPRRLTSGTRDSSPRWSPDGRQLAFLRAIERDGRPQPPQIYLLALDGGEARAITDVARGASAPIWSPDGSRIAFNSTTRPDDVPPAKDAKPESKTDGPKSDVRVITSAVYRSNGGGWNDPERRSHLWVTDVQPSPTIAVARRMGQRWVTSLLHFNAHDRPLLPPR
jgi:dipeptidyl aminopeptidase/acylaminoacyl peptidase